MVQMTTSEAIDHYRTQTKLAIALGIAQSTVSEWGEYPPDLHQIRLERITRGKLRAEPSVWLPRKKKRAA
jgi:hypothetical protein